MLSKEDGSKDSKDAKNEIRVLLLDNQTSSIISMYTTQSELLRNEIYLMDKIDNFQRDKLRNLKCICFLKPDDHTVANLSKELTAPNYLSYEVYFNNIISNPRLERLAESDDMEMVTKVVEIFQDYYIINKQLFTSVNIDNPLSDVAIDSWQLPAFNESVESLMSLLLSVKFKPVIKYESNSKMCTKLANSINYEINSNSNLFNNLPAKDTPPLLLILDRKNDPITPLLSPWTYQSMIHELIGIRNNTVDLSSLPNVTEELKTIVINELQDQFYKDAMYSNFGELSESLRKFIEVYKSKTKTNSNIDSIKDMKFFLENYPEFKKTSLNLSKHMLLSTEIDRKINELRLWEIGELEQTMASNDDHHSDLAELENLLFDKKTTTAGAPLPPLKDNLKLKLLCIYALRYENHSNNQTTRLIKTLRQSGFPVEELQFVQVLLNYAGTRKRFSNEDDSIFDKIQNSGLVNGLNLKGNTDSGNVYMQHVPRLHAVLTKLFRNKLSLKNYPILKPTGLESYTSSDKIPPQEIVVYFVGGVTYEEARLIAELNRNNASLKIVLGSTNIVNSSKFISNLKRSGSNWTGSRASTT
ncbi:hypothetical protein CANARDRAFT_192865 [[Candida] arabinofermentans NRRL YB-2248]|uniref:Vacuolar protein sorting-associated protein 45 n=1 Tax=[Candida] arabinofermentans NRRL YB-2248 TaxID=983967 RepID=A0A1E4T906_9ASCO|nr:hypothetical protein CANARDRAFT_192865 [[Candida] arabinofermentans NRRL YB-2248]